VSKLAYNIPSYDVNNFSFGPGILYIGVTGATPTTDVGASTGGVLRVTRTILPVDQGTPKMRVHNLCSQELVELEFTSIEWDVLKMAMLLGAGETASASNVDSIDLGGDFNYGKWAVHYQHRMPAGYTLNIYLWEAIGSGETENTFGDALHEMGYKFQAVRATTDWNSASIAEKKQYCHIEINKDT
jgi:hypothetical protein